MLISRQSRLTALAFAAKNPGTHGYRFLAARGTSTPRAASIDPPRVRRTMSKQAELPVEWACADNSAVHRAGVLRIPRRAELTYGIRQRELARECDNHRGAEADTPGPERRDDRVVCCAQLNAKWHLGIKRCFGVDVEANMGHTLFGALALADEPASFRTKAQTTVKRAPRQSARAIEAARYASRRWLSTQRRSVLPITRGLGDDRPGVFPKGYAARRTKSVSIITKHTDTPSLKGPSREADQAEEALARPKRLEVGVPRHCLLEKFTTGKIKS